MLPFLAAFPILAAAPQAAPMSQDAKMKWFREARFGMFIHWGVYSGLGGDWQGKPVGGYAEHIQRRAKIPIPVYRKEVAGNQLNPIGYRRLPHLLSRELDYWRQVEYGGADIRVAVRNREREVAGCASQVDQAVKA